MTHARKQGGADGFQQGWHAAIARYRDGTSLDELATVLPYYPTHCECGSVLTQCSSCAVADWQAAHPDCRTCCPIVEEAPPPAGPSSSGDQALIDLINGLRAECGKVHVVSPEHGCCCMLWKAADKLASLLKANLRWQEIADGMNATLAEQAQTIASLRAELKAATDCPSLLCPFEKRAEQAEALAADLRQALRFDQPWPVWEVLKCLADAAEHFLRDHDCDHHGWELTQSAALHALNIAAALASASGAPDRNAASKDLPASHDVPVNPVPPGPVQEC